MKVKLIFVLFFVTLALCAVFSCRDFDDEENESGDSTNAENTTSNSGDTQTIGQTGQSDHIDKNNETEQTAFIIVSVENPTPVSRTIAPVRVCLDELTYTLTGILYENGVPKSTSVLLSDVGYDEIGAAKITVVVGQWIFLLTASKDVENKGRIPFYQGQSSAMISVGSNTAISFNLSEVRGEGDVSVSLAFPDNAEIVRIEAGLLSLDRQALSGFELKDITSTKTSPTNGKCTVTYTASDVPSGNYIVQFKFYRQAVSVSSPTESVSFPEEIEPGYMEIVQIRNGRKSEGMTSEIGELEKYHTITYIWNAPTDPMEKESIDFSGYSDSKKLPLIFNEQKEIILPTATDIPREGYTFLGWCEDEKLTSAKKTVGWNAEQKDVTLYAKWQRDVEKLGAYKVLGSGEIGDVSVSGGTYVTFGSFPQPRKKADVKVLYFDEGDTGAENVMTQGDQTWYLGSDGEWYAQRRAKPYDASRTFSDGTAIANGTAYWFKVCPIKWRVLPSGKLLAESIVETTPYKSAFKKSTPWSNNYKESDVRNYLNGSFLKGAFTDEQRQKLKLTEICNAVSHSTDSSGVVTKADGSAENTVDYSCENTSDAIFLLSEWEVTTTSDNFGVYNANDSARIRKPTDWARANGAYYAAGTEAGYWWLRSPYYYADFYVQGVSPSGDANGAEAAMLDDTGVVPALCVN